MNVGDLVKMRCEHGFRSGIVVGIEADAIRGYHTVRVHFVGHQIKKLNGLQWCNPRDLEVI